MTTSGKPGKRPARPACNWDLKLAAVLFISTCATMSLVLPNWLSPLDSAAEAVSAAPEPAPAPDQRQAAMASYRAGRDQLRKGRYNAAATEFKKALEQSADLAEAYVGLGDAYNHLEEYVAAETNARHALSKLKLLRVRQAPDPTLKKELAHAHKVLGVALLHLAEAALNRHEATTGRMQALEASSHCNLAMAFDQGDRVAHDCAQQAEALTHS